MSEQVNNILMHIGSDPRHMAEFEAIRQEINKVSHPRQPEVNWKSIESLALTVFRRNGVDLQTAAYYALARIKLAGLSGFTEGCELMAGIITAEWERCWPDNDAAQIDILDWFNAKAGNALRAMTFDGKSLRLLYRAERALQLIHDKLQQAPLSRVPRVENLLIFIQNTGRRVEREKDDTAPRAPTQTLVWMPGEGGQPPRISAAELPAQREADADTPDEAQSVAVDIVDPARAQISEPESLTEVQATVPSADKTVTPARGGGRWSFPAFFLGVASSLAVAAVAAYWYVMPLKAQLEEVAQQPLGAALLWLAQPDAASYGQQLNRLASVPPYMALALGEQSVAEARQRWPDNGQLNAETARWQVMTQLSDTTPLPDGGYFFVHQRLKRLNEELLEQERVRGGLTISYLKTAVYQMQSALTTDVPLEELLRQLEAATRNGEPAPALLIKQLNERWNMLSGRYYRLIRE